MTSRVFRSHKGLSFLLVAAIVLSACSQKYYYAKGLEHARNPTPASVYDHLITVTPDNKNLTWRTINDTLYVLAASWKDEAKWYIDKNKYSASAGCDSYNTGSRPMWVSLAPQLKEKHLGGLSDKKLRTRLNQLLGLPPQARYNYFLEIWVKPQDLFRPCFDPRIDQNPCEFAASKEDAKRTVHMSWLYKYIFDSYSNTEDSNRYPFTHLGYTYDWNPKNKSHVGLSEFVIDTNKTIYIKKVYTTREYIE